MDFGTLSLWGRSVPLLGYSSYKKRGHTKAAMTKSKGIMKGMLVDIVASVPGISI